jgi:YD repeat-containing protein
MKTIWPPLVGAPLSRTVRPSAGVYRRIAGHACKRSPWCAVVLGFSLWAGGGVSQAQLRVSPSDGAHYFYGDFLERPVVAIGEAPPDPGETDQLLSVVVASRAALRVAAQLPLAPRDQARRAVVAEQAGAFDQFATEHPQSAWTPGLRANLGTYYLRIGRMSLALRHWQAAWEATKRAPGGRAKEVADYALAHLGRLLSNLGRWEGLHALFQETAGRVLDRGPLSQKWARTRESYVRVTRWPAGAYNCGVAALECVGVALQGPAWRRQPYGSLPANIGGVSLLTLSQLAQERRLGLTAVFRQEGLELVAPSVVHWRLNHYGAIVARRGEFYEVVDPVFERRAWLTAEAILAEASGYFLVPTALKPAGWRLAPESESAFVSGRGNPYYLDDYVDHQCPDPSAGLCHCAPGLGGGGFGGGAGGFGGAGGGAGGGTAGWEGTDSDWGSGGWGGGGNGCGGCGGMPAWQVSEPFINLWLLSEPLAYRAGMGQRISFGLAYKQRDEAAGSQAEIFSVGYSWNSSWLSYVWTYIPTNFAYLYLPNGGKLSFTFTNQTMSDYYSNLRLSYVTTNDEFLRFELAFPDGSTNVYGFPRADLNGHAEFWFLSAFRDPQGRQTQFLYEGYDPDPANGQVVRLTRVIDPDGLPSTVHYSTNHPSATNLVDHVSDPWGRTAWLCYTNWDDPNGTPWHLLSGVTDAAGIGHYFTYDDLGWPKQMVTPYGTTTFAPVDNSLLGGTDKDRSVTIREPEGSHRLFAFVQLCLEMDETYPPSLVPQGTPLDTFDYLTRQQRNTLYWDPEQYQQLSSTNIADFNARDYRLARLRHWLGWAQEGQSGSIDTLAIERAPSPDGTAEGQLTWYDHAGKPPSFREEQGTQILPAVVARVMPDSSTWYIHYQRDTWGKATNQIEKWVGSAGACYRTNTFVYAANEYDLVRHIGPDAVTVAGYAYDAAHPHLPIRMTNAVGEVTAYTYDAQHRLQTVQRPSGLLSTYSYSQDAYLASVVDSAGGVTVRTNRFTWLNGQLYTHIDARNLTRTFTWDALRRLTRLDYPDGSWEEWRYTNAAGALLRDPTAVKDRLDRWTFHTYDALRRRTMTIDPLLRTNTWSYCGCGGPDYVTLALHTPLAEVTHYVYDLAARRTHLYLPDGSSATNAYDALNRLVISCDAQGSLTNVYDNLGRLATVNNAAGQHKRTVYDANDRVLELTDANGVTVTNTYDALGRLLTRRYADSGVEAYGYIANVAGPTSYTNQLGCVTLYAYDALGRKTNEVFVGLATNSFGYNAAGDLLTLRDGKNQVTTWAYNTEGLVTHKWDARGTNILQYLYDPNGRLTNRWSAAKGNTRYLYDPLGNLTNVDYAVSADLRFQYDALYRLTNMVDATGTTAYSYSHFGAKFEPDTVTSSPTPPPLTARRLAPG